MNNTDEWAPFQLKEQPFWRPGMSPEEYDAERDYLYEHYQEFESGMYMPLWRQDDRYKNNHGWPPFQVTLRPFWRDGMTWQEYYEERDYYYKHYDDVKEGRHIPLWELRQG